MSRSFRAPGSKGRPLWAALLLAAAFSTLSIGDAIGALTPFERETAALQMTPQVMQLLEDADKAVAAGNLNLALLQLKNAVRLAPANGEVHWRIGDMWMRVGSATFAEPELRIALAKEAPEATVIPRLLTAMIQLRKYKELLAEFPDPPKGTQDPLAAEILKFRAIALQLAGQPKEASAAIQRSFQVRRDVSNIVIAADLLRQQGEVPAAQSFLDEAIRLDPANVQALLLNVMIARQTQDQKKMLAAADEFVNRAPNSVLAKVTRIEALLQANDDARAKLDVDSFTGVQQQLYGRYYRGLMMARVKNFKGAWQYMRSLPPLFVQEDPRRAMTIAGIAAGAGSSESAAAILTTLLTHFPEIKEIRTQLAAIRLAQNAPHAALEALIPIRESDDPTVHALLGQAFLALGQFDDAIGSLEIASAAPKDNDLVKRQLAVAELQVGDSGKALSGLRDLIRSDPDNPALTGPMVAALVRTAKWEEALALVDALGKKNPNSPNASFNRGQILVARGDLEGAQTAFDRALTIDPKFEPALFYRANVSLALGNPEAAAKNLETLVAQNPANMPSYIRLAQLASDAGREDEAVAWIERAIKAAPTNTMPRMALANYRISRREYKEAQAAVDGLLEVSKDNADALALRGRIQLLQGATLDAVETFQKLVAINNVSPIAYELLANALLESKDQNGAELAAKRGVELAPNSSQLTLSLMDIQTARDKPLEALATARAFAVANPGPLGDSIVADALLRLKRTSEAETVLRKSLIAKPDPRVASSLSKLAFASGDAKAGVAVLANWVSNNPNDYEMRREYASARIRTGDLAAARKDYEALLKQHPHDPLVLNNLGWLIQKDDPNRALTMLTLANKISPRAAYIADTLGWLKYQRKDHQGALPLLQRAHDIDGGNAPISYHLALALDATGKRAEAKSLLQATLAKNPKFDGSDDAQRVLRTW